MGIYSVIRKTNEKNKDKLAVSITMDNGTEREFTYEMLFSKCEIYFNELKACGVEKGDRVVIVADNSPEWNIAYLAIMKMKCTAVLIDASLTKEDILSLIYKSDARCVFTCDKIIDKLKGIPSINIPFLDIMDNGKPFRESIKTISKELPKTIDGDEEVALIIYSSGTTKLPSGIMHTHSSMIETIKITSKENNLTCNERILSILPNSHIYGVVTALLGSMMLGASLHYIESINSEALLNAFKNFKPTVFPCVPKIYELFEKQIVKKINSKQFTKCMFKMFFPICNVVRKHTNINLGKIIFKSIHKGFGGDLRLMTCAGAPLDESVAQFYYGTGFNMLITYGLTETNIPVIGNRGKKLMMDSCGKPYPNINIKLANKDENGAGEIYVKSPYVMKGYFRDEEANKQAFDGEWFKTGDIAVFDSNENIKIVGRSKENIVLATGKKVTPDDIESKYGRIAGVKEFVIAGVPVHNTDYDEVHAFIVKEGLSVSSEDILKEIQNKGSELSLYMKIAKVHFLDEIPKTSLQKPKRYLLKKYALEDIKHIEINEKEETVNKNIEDELVDIIVKVGNLDRAVVSKDSKIFMELGIDSLGAIELSVQVQEKWGVVIDNILNENTTINEIVSFIKAPNKEKVSLSKVYINRKKDFHYKVFRFHCRLAHILYKINVKNHHNIPSDSGYIICSNHVSNIDYLWLAINFKREQFLKFSCMAKKELFNNSFLSKLLIDTCGMLPVERGGINSEVIKCCKKQLDDKWGLLIHPEGTRSSNGKLGELKKGAATIAKESNVPIIPAYIKGAYEVYPKGNKIPKLFNWKKLKRYNIEVIYGEPIYPNSLSAEEITKKVESSILKLI